MTEKRNMNALKILLFFFFTTMGSVLSEQRLANPVLRLSSSSLSSLSSVSSSSHVAREREQRHFEEGARTGRNLKLYANGDVKLLVVMVNPDVLSITETEVKQYLFADSNSASSQFYACSQGELRIKEFNESPISFTTQNPIESYDYSTLVDDELAPFLKSKYGVDQISKISAQILFVIPKNIQNPGSNTGWARSPGNDVGILENYIPSVMNSLHEMGHNYGLDHTFEAGVEYEEQSTAMGAQDSSVVNICFNGYQMYKMDWFWERSMIIDQITNTGDLVKVAFVEDYDLTNADEYMWVAINDFQIFLSFNRKRGINSQTLEHGDKLLVNALQPDYDGDETPGTNLLAALDADSEPYTLPNFQNGQNLVIEVCSFTPKSDNNNADYLTVAIGTVANLCNTETMASNMNTDLPTSAWTSVPMMYFDNEGNGYYDWEKLPTMDGDNEGIPTMDGDNEQIPEMDGDNERIPAMDGDNEQIPEMVGDKEQITTTEDNEAVKSDATAAAFPSYNEWRSSVFWGCYISVFALYACF